MPKINMIVIQYDTDNDETVLLKMPSFKRKGLNLLRADILQDAQYLIEEEYDKQLKAGIF